MSSNIQAITQGPSIGAWQDAFTWTYAEGASQSFVSGAPLKLTSGLALIISSVTAPTIAGIALTPASGTTGTMNNPLIKVILPLPDTLFQVSVDTTTTSGQAALGTGKPSDFNIGTNYQLLLDSTSGNYYMGTGTGNPVFQYVGVDPSQYSLVNGRVYVRILTSQTIYS